MRQGLPGISASVNDFTLREEVINENHYWSGEATQETRDEDGDDGCFCSSWRKDVDNRGIDAQ